MSYQTNSQLNRNEWVSDGCTEDPDNLPQPLGWHVLVRPYPIKEQTKGGIIIANESIDYMSNLINIGRVVSIGPCCWNRTEHFIDGEQSNWVQVGDFVAWPRHKGHKRKFKDVSFVLLSDDELVEKLPDPLVFKDEMLDIDIPQEHLEKYNTIYNPNWKGQE